MKRECEEKKRTTRENITAATTTNRHKNDCCLFENVALVCVNILQVHIARSIRFVLACPFVQFIPFTYSRCGKYYYAHLDKNYTFFLCFYAIFCRNKKQQQQHKQHQRRRNSFCLNKKKHDKIRQNSLY